MRPRSGGDAWRFSAGAGRARRPRVCPASSDAWPAPCRHAWGLDGDVPASQTSSFASRGSVSETSSDLPSHKKSSRARTPHALAAVSSACRSSGVGGGSASIASWRLGPPRPRPGPTAPPSGLSGLSLSASDSGGLRSAESRSPKRSTTPRQERPNGPVRVTEGAGGRWNEAPVADLRARGCDLSGSGGSVHSEGPPPWEAEVARRPRGGTQLRGGRSRARGASGRRAGRGRCSLEPPEGPAPPAPGLRPETCMGAAPRPWGPQLRDVSGGSRKRRKGPSLSGSPAMLSLSLRATVTPSSSLQVARGFPSQTGRPRPLPKATPAGERGVRAPCRQPGGTARQAQRAGGGGGPPTRPLPTPPCPPCPGG